MNDSPISWNLLFLSRARTIPWKNPAQLHSSSFSPSYLQKPFLHKEFIDLLHVLGTCHTQNTDRKSRRFFFLSFFLGSSKVKHNCRISSISRPVLFICFAGQNKVGYAHSHQRKKVTKEKKIGRVTNSFFFCHSSLTIEVVTCGIFESKHVVGDETLGSAFDRPRMTILNI